VIAPNMWIAARPQDAALSETQIAVRSPVGPVAPGRTRRRRPARYLVREVGCLIRCKRLIRPPGVASKPRVE